MLAYPKRTVEIESIITRAIESQNCESLTRLPKNHCKNLAKDKYTSGYQPQSDWIIIFAGQFLNENRPFLSKSQ